MNESLFRKEVSDFEQEDQYHDHSFRNDADSLYACIR